MANADFYRGNGAWNTVYMPPNQFLQQRDHDDEMCFCNNCRERRYREVTAIGVNRGTDWLQEMCLVHLPLGRERKANTVYKNTLTQIIYGHAYKEACLADTNYKYWKSWAKTQPQFEHLVDGNYRSKKTFNDLATDINESSYVYRNWDEIVNNLTDQRLTCIDARTFSVRMFYCARNLDWCLSYNETLRKKGNSNGELPYSQDKVDEIFQHMVNTGIFEDMGHNPKLAAGLGEALKLKMTSYCRRKYQPDQE